MSGNMKGGPKRSIVGSIRNAFSSSSSSKNSSRNSPKQSSSMANDKPSMNPFSDANAAAEPPPPAPPAYSPFNAAGVQGLQPAAVELAADASTAGASGSDEPLEINENMLNLDTDPYGFLSYFDTVFLIDDSGSMAGSRWNQVKTVLGQIVPICAAHDKDGVDVHFLNHTRAWKSLKDAGMLEQMFRQVFPMSATPTGARIGNLLFPYLDDFEAALRHRGGGDPRRTGLKPINLIVITDGEPNDPRELERVLLEVATRLDRARAPSYQIGIQFFQVGDDPGAAEALRMLDDNLGGRVSKGKLRDIIDTVTFDIQDSGKDVLTSEAVLKVVLGAVLRKIDRRHLEDQRKRKFW